MRKFPQPEEPNRKEKIGKDMIETTAYAVARATLLMESVEGAVIVLEAVPSDEDGSKKYMARGIRRAIADHKRDQEQSE